MTMSVPPNDSPLTAPPTNTVGTADISLLPLTARRLLSAAQMPPAQALAAPGIILFCDLSGFSRMGADAVVHSARGAETLQATINAIFSRVVDVIGDHGGAVLYFAGDAVASHWPTGPDPETTLRAAIACGLAVQRSVEGLPDELGQLAMRCGLSLGDLWLLDVDAPGGRQAVFVGPALEAVQDLDLTAHGVRLAPSVVGQLPDGIPMDEDSAGPRVRHITAATAPRQLPTPLDARPWLRAHQQVGLKLGADWLAEFRQVYVAFIRHPDFQFNGSDGLDAAASLLRDIAACVEAEGGALLQTCYDDKGLVAIAAWGLGTSVWEDSADRSVRAAQAVTNTLPVVAAVAGGKVFAGLVGAAPYLQHVIVGDAINRAAAMSTAAAAPLTLDEATAEAVARRFGTHEVARLSLKGQAEPASVHAVSAERLRGLTHAGKMIGRKGERERLQVLTARLADGEAVDLRITGESGLGKSRLAAWFSDLLAAADVSYHEMQADSMRRAIGLAPFAPLVARLLDLALDADAVTCRDAVIAVLGTDRADLLPLLSPILPTDLPETEASRIIAGPGRAQLTLDLAVALLTRLLPTDRYLLMVEDAHWLDSASWQLLDALTSRSPASVCLVTRALSADDLPTEARRFLDTDRVETLELSPLDASESAELAAQTLGTQAVAPPLADFVYRRAAGHPLFTASLVLALAARGVAPVAGGYAHLKLGKLGLEQLGLPTDTAGVIDERISRLPASQQLTIRVAAVLGREFHIDALAELHPSAARPQIEDDLSRIARAGLLEPAGPGQWRFHHAIISDVAYQSLVSDQARRLHAAVVTRLAAQSGETPEQANLTLMAHHAERADDRDAALRYLAAAAEGARRAYANLEVVDFLTRALALAETGGDTVDPVTRARWLYHIAYALRALGQYQRAEDFLERCITDLDRAPPKFPGQAARGLFGGYLAYRLRPHRPARPETERAPLILAADATMMLSEIHYELNKIPFALAEILRGANLARAAGGDSATLAKLYIGMALISTALPWALDGDALQARALEIVGRLDDPATECWIYMVSGNFETGKGGWEKGAAHFHHAMAVADTCGERKTWETAASTLANLKRLEGRFEDAIGWSDVTLAASRDRGIVHGIIWSHNGRARDLLCLSRWDELRVDVAALERLLDDPANALDANDNNRLVFHYTRAVLALSDGDDVGSMADLDAALDILAHTKRPQVYMTQNAPFYSDLIWALWERGHQGNEMLARQAQVAASARRIGRQYRAGVPMAAQTVGDGHWIRGTPDKALAHWRKAAKAAEARGMSYAAAHALDRIARTGLDDAAAAARDRHLELLGITLPRLWRLS